MAASERQYEFPSPQDVARFMGVLDMYTCWSVEGFYAESTNENQHGDLIITQALPHVRVKCPWRVNGCVVTFDMTYVEAHFEPFRKQRVYDHMLELARRFGFGGSNSPRRYGGVSVRFH
ncbi:MAG: hypothetical protein KC503_37255 [Myxococcales bacterium]|nr:hypothetical protein [Myxococcales bacterium]